MPASPDRQLVAAVFDRLIPADEWPAVSGPRLWAHLDGLAADPATATTARRIHHTIASLDDGADLDGAIAALEWRDRDRLVQVAAQVYYGAADAPGARMVGFDPGPKRDPLAVVAEHVPTTTPFDDIATAYDVIVLGAGAGGGVAACVLAEAGATVLLVDRGWATAIGDVGRDHLRNHRSSILGQNTGPTAPGNPREFVDRHGRVLTIERPHDPRWHNNAMAVGGGTRVYMGMAWRFLPDDFRLASIHGVPDGSSLADWPISYDDLEPHYEWAEWNIGVCGDGSRHPAAGPRTRDYPMPSLPANTEAAVLGAGAEAIGLHTGPVPLLLNSVPRDDRPQCVRCGECVGFACMVDAKNGTQNTVIPRAMATGRTTLVDGCRAVEITTDAGGRVDGARLIDERTGSTRQVRAGQVVVACGAIESARLLLASRSAAHPDGLGNATDQVGRHLQGHATSSVFGLFTDELIDPEGPGVSIATLDHNHGHGVIGGVLANEITKLPIIHWNWAMHPEAPRWGAEGKAAMRESFRRTGHLFTQVQEVPRAQNRISLSTVVDGLGIPVARLEGSMHAETTRAVEHMLDLGERWLDASGAHTVWRDRIVEDVTAGQHQAGTCRMGADPATSVVGADGRVHGHPNLWVCDASTHVTNGGVNPVLTIFANAHRIAQIVAGS